MTNCGTPEKTLEPEAKTLRLNDEVDWLGWRGVVTQELEFRRDHKQKMIRVKFKTGPTEHEYFFHEDGRASVLQTEPVLKLTRRPRGKSCA